MRANDMLDVIHYMMEDDYLRAVPMAENPIKAMSSIRASIYLNMYLRVYEGEITDEVDTVGTPLTKQVERSTPTTTNSVTPYTPPTDPEKLAGIVGEPLS